MSEYNLGHTDGYYIGVTEGERQERAAIVAWLRGEYAFLEPTASNTYEVGFSHGVDYAADHIGRGEHIKNPDESSHVPTTGKEGFNDE